MENDYLFLTLFFCSLFQKVKFRDAFYAPPVVVVSPRLGYNNNKSRFSGLEPCNLVTAWVEVRNILPAYSFCGSNRENLFKSKETLFSPLSLYSR